MIFGRILADATARRLNSTAPKPAFFRKALWEQSPDPSELPDPRLIDFLCPAPEENQNGKDVRGKAPSDKAVVPTATAVTQDATTFKNVTHLKAAKHVGKPGAIVNDSTTRAATARVQAAAPRPKADIPHVDVEFFMFAAVAYGLGAWNQPELVNKICALIRYDVKTMLDRLLPKADDTIICLALFYITKLFGERPSVSVLATGWGDTLAPLRIIRLGLTLAYKWHEDYPHRYQCALCPLEVCDCLEWNGGETRGRVRDCPKDKNNVIKEIWKPTQFHPLLPRYALARMEKEALIKLDYDISVDMGGLEWIGFLGRLRDVCNMDAGAQRVSEDGYRLTRLAIFELVQTALHNRFRVKKAKAA